jgi:hypothetical protein
LKKHTVYFENSNDAFNALEKLRSVGMDADETDVNNHGESGVEWHTDRPLKASERGYFIRLTQPDSIALNENVEE